VSGSLKLVLTRTDTIQGVYVFFVTHFINSRKKLMPGPVNHQNTQPIHHHTPTSQPNKLSRFLKALRKVSNDICTRFVDLFCGCFSKPKPGTENTTSKTTQDDSQANCLSTSTKSIIEEIIMELIAKHNEEHPADFKEYDSEIKYKEVFNQLREKGKTVLHGLRLPVGADVTNTNLNELKLILLNAQEADFRGSTMRNTDMFGANMRRTNLNDLDLSTTELRCARFNGASLENVNFSGNKSLKFIRFSEANLQKANFNNTKLHCANFKKADLEGADLTGAYLKGANLKGTDFTNADLRNVDMTEDELRASGAILNGAKVGNDSTWKKL